MSGAHPSEGSSNPSSPSSTHNNAFFNYQAAVNNNAPKYGTVVPKRVFVGGITATTTEDELCDLFSQYGIVKQVKIVVDRAGISKGYGFITFDSEEEAKRLQKDSDNIMFKEKRLNIAPAIKKQGFTGTYDSLPTVTSPAPPVSTPNMYYHNGLPYTYHNGMAFFPSNGQPMVPTSPPSVSTQETTIYPQQTYAPPPSHQGSQTAAYGAPIMYAQHAPMFMPTQQYQYSPMPFESFYQVAAPNTASYIYASPGQPLVGAPSTGAAPESLQYQLYQQPAPPADVYYTAAPMYPMLVNYDPAYYPYSIESTASSTSTGVDVSSNSNYSEELEHPPPPQHPHPRSTETPVVSLLKLQDTPHEEREVNNTRQQRPVNNNSAPRHNKSNNNPQHESPALIYYPSNMYATPGQNTKYTMYHSHRPNPRGGANNNYSNNNNYRHKTPPHIHPNNSNYIATQRTPQQHNHNNHTSTNNNNYNKFPTAARPMYYNNNNNNNVKYNPGDTTPSCETNKQQTNAHDSPKRSISPPPPPYSPMIQPLFTNCESPYSFSPPAPPMIQPPPMPLQYPPHPLPPAQANPRPYQPVQNHNAPPHRRMNPPPRTNGKQTVS
uniref:Protein boule-like n=1 Tax=Cacopsylla melanoneura TaxID=428564 RepID=A0A8D8ZJZ0_9HEMI